MLSASAVPSTTFPARAQTRAASSSSSSSTPSSSSSSSSLSLLASPTIAIGTPRRRAARVNNNEDVGGDTSDVRRNIIASLERGHQQHGWHRQTNDLLVGSVGTSRRNGVSIATTAATAAAVAAVAVAEHAPYGCGRDDDDDDGQRALAAGARIFL